jgi:hypothetical protein
MNARFKIYALILKLASNNCFNLINPLSRFVLLATLVYAQTAPSPSGADLKVKHMFHGRFAHGCTIIDARAVHGAGFAEKIHYVHVSLYL